MALPRKNLPKKQSGAASPKPSSPLATNTTTPTPSSRPSSPLTPATRDYAALLGLPLKLELIAPERTVEGTLFTYDHTTSLVVLASPSPSAASVPTPTSGSASPATSQNPSRPPKYSFHFIKTSQIKTVQVLSPVPTSPPVVLPTPTTIPTQTELNAIVEKAIKLDQMERAKVGVGVSEEAQALFDGLARTLPVRWHEKSMVVMDEVLIQEPYGIADVKGGKGAGERIERVRKVLEGERQRWASRQAARVP